MVLAKTIKLGIQVKGTGKAVGKKTPKEKTSPFLT